VARRKTYTPEEIVAKLRQAEVLVGQGKSVAEAVRAIGVTEPTYYRWRTEFGGLKLDQVKRLKGSAHCAERAGKRAAAQGGVGPDAREGHPEGSRVGKVVSPARRRGCVEHVVRELGVSERRACAVLGQHRSTQRKAPRAADDEAALTVDIVELARRYGRYGYRRITALLRDVGWVVNRKRVERIWRREGLKVPQRQPKRGRLWLADGSCIRLRPERANHVWAYDFVEDRTRDGRKFRMLCVVDEFTREALAIRVARRLPSSGVIDVLADLFLAHGTPVHIRSDQGPEFIAEAVKAWIAGVGARTAYIEKASPWENGYVESFNGKLRDELLNGEVFNTLREAQVLIEEWRRHYNRVRPHSALGYRPPAPETLPTPRAPIGSGARQTAVTH
jgi:transposase InsO family protein